MKKKRHFSANATNWFQGSAGSALETTELQALQQSHGSSAFPGGAAEPGNEERKAQIA